MMICRVCTDNYVKGFTILRMTYAYDILEVFTIISCRCWDVTDITDFSYL